MIGTICYSSHLSYLNQLVKVYSKICLFNVLNKLVSSANIVTLVFTLSGISFTQIKKRLYPNTDPLEPH